MSEYEISPEIRAHFDDCQLADIMLGEDPVPEYDLADYDSEEGY